VAEALVDEGQLSCGVLPDLRQIDAVLVEMSGAESADRWAKDALSVDEGSSAAQLAVDGQRLAAGCRNQGDARPEQTPVESKPLFIRKITSPRTGQYDGSTGGPPDPSNRPWDADVSDYYDLFLAVDLPADLPEPVLVEVKWLLGQADMPAELKSTDWQSCGGSWQAFDGGSRATRSTAQMSPCWFVRRTGRTWTAANRGP
jgi:hypothetical protein